MDPNKKPSGKEEKNRMIAFLSVVAAVCIAVCILTMTTDWFAPEKEYANLILYEGPEPIPASDAVSMQVDGHALFVYDTAVNNTYTWDAEYTPALSTVPIASFDFDGAPVTMEITVNDATALDNVLVRPLAKNIVPTVNGNVIRFQISDPDVYTVEWGENTLNAAHIFANPIDYDAPTESSENLLYIGPGAWNIGTLELKNDMEIYISGGAVVRGVVSANTVKNAKISGHGWIDGSHNESWMLLNLTAYVPVKLHGCKNVTVSGIAMLDPNAWCMELYNCNNVQVDAVKIITARPNGDGISVQSCRSVTVSDTFVRSWDDCLVVKNYADQSGSDSADITFDNCQLWTDLAQSMEVGYETNKGKKANATMQNISFQNITVLHGFHKPIMSIHNADDAAISDVRFENIIVEDASMGNGDAGENAQLIDITIVQNHWSNTEERGTVDNIVFDGIYVLGGKSTCPIRIQGYDETHRVTNVTVKDLSVLGKTITDTNVTDDPGTSIDQFTENIRFITE